MNNAKTQGREFAVKIIENITRRPGDITVSGGNLWGPFPKSRASIEEMIKGVTIENVGNDPGLLGRLRSEYALIRDRDTMEAGTKRFWRVKGSVILTGGPVEDFTEAFSTELRRNNPDMLPVYVSFLLQILVRDVKDDKNTVTISVS